MFPQLHTLPTFTSAWHLHPPEPTQLLQVGTAASQEEPGCQWTLTEPPVCVKAAADAGTAPSSKPCAPHTGACQKTASSASLWHASESILSAGRTNDVKSAATHPQQVQCLIKNHWNQEDKNSHKISWSSDPSLMWGRIKSDENKWTFCWGWLFFFSSQNRTHLTFPLRCWIFGKSEASISQIWQFSMWYFSV